MRLRADVLEGRFVRLEPYAPRLRDELQAALDCDAEAWSLLASSGQGEQFDGWWTLSLRQMEEGTRIPFAVRERASGRVVGSTSFLNIRIPHRVVEVGSTFLRPEVRSGAVNPDAKLLMLGHAFDAGANRVELVTDLRNVRSQAAIAKLGAVREGVLRRDRVTWTGHVRDTVFYSVIPEEWPTVREGLERRLASFS